MKKILNESRLCELAGLHQEEDTQDMPPVQDPAVTRKLTPLEFKRELSRYAEVEKYTEEDFLNMWRQWSAEKRKAEKANEPPPPVTDVLPPADVGKSITATQEIGTDTDPTGAEFQKKWRGKKYTESERLFRHFFGRYLDDTRRPTPALLAQMKHDGQLASIIIQLYGWQLPSSFRTTAKGAVEEYEGPGTDIMKIAQEFELEDKSIEGNEEEFLERLQNYQLKTGKAQVEPQRQIQSRALAKKMTLRDIIEKHKKDPRFSEELPPLAHAGAYGMKVEEYAKYLMTIFKDEYEKLYKKYLDALLS